MSLKFTICLLFSWLSVLYSQRDINWQNPYPQGNSLNDVRTFGDSIFIVGDYATIIYSFDNGKSWSVKTNIDNIQTNFNQAYFPNSHTVFIVGNGGTALTYNFDSENRTSVNIGTNNDLLSVYFANNLNRWVGDSEGILYNTTDAGVTWRRDSLEKGYKIIRIHFADKNKGWCLAVHNGGDFFTERSKIFRTTDAGRTWRVINDDYLTYRDMVFTDSLNGFATFNVYNHFLRTTDGGESWRDVEIISPEQAAIDNISFLDSLTGYGTGLGKIYSTTDGGINWHQYGAESEQRFNSIFVQTGGAWIAAGNNGIIYQSPGDTLWRKISRNIPYNFKGIHFPDDNTGWIVGQHSPKNTYNPKWSSYVLRTKNKGSDWETAGKFDKIVLENIYFTDSLNGWVVGNRILKTSDGGLNWIEQQPDTNIHLYSVNFYTPQTGWACGTDGKLLHTSDGGESWNYKDVNTEKALLDISFPDESTIYICGESGTVFKSVNSGENWSELFPFTDEHLNAIDFKDSLTGFCAGESIFKTTDGGNNWEVKYFADTPIHDIKIIGNSIWAIGYNGQMLYSSDTGENWTTLISPTNKRLTALAFYKNEIWIAGYDGVILSTDPVITSIKRDRENYLNNFALSQNYPNPFNPTTTIMYAIPASVNGHSSLVQLKIYNILGEEVTTLVNEKQAPGRYTVKFNANNLASGVYIYRLKINNVFNTITQTKKMALLK